jgi:haloalkane dehalogenase
MAGPAREDGAMNRQRRRVLHATGLLLARALPGCAVHGSDDAHAIVDGLTAERFTALRRFAGTSFGKVAYVSQGAGRAVLLLHGFPLNSFQWRGAIERLAPHALCIAPDFLGMGHSEVAPEQDIGPQTQAAMLVSLLDALGIAQADVIANDSGGAVAQLLVARYPARVRSLLLTNCDTGMQSPPAAMHEVIELARQGQFVDRRLAHWLADPQIARSDQGIGGLCYADRAHPTDEALHMYFGPPLSSPERKAALHRYAVALGRNALAEITPALRASRVPTRIAWGMADGIFHAASADYLDRSFGNSHGVRRLPDAKLFWPEERPGLIAAQARILWESAPA